MIVLIFLLFLIFLAVFDKTKLTENYSADEYHTDISSVISVPEYHQMDTEPRSGCVITETTTAPDVDVRVRVRLSEVYDSCKAIFAQLRSWVRDCKWRVVLTPNDKTNPNGFYLEKDIDKISENQRDITAGIVRMLEKHDTTYEDQAKFCLHELHTNDNILASNKEKGQKISVCVRTKESKGCRKDGTNCYINDANSILRVVIHELTHSMDIGFRGEKDHGECFYQYERFMLRLAAVMGLYKCPVVSSNRIPFCGLTMDLHEMCGGKGISSQTACNESPEKYPEPKKNGITCTTDINNPITFHYSGDLTPLHYTTNPAPIVDPVISRVEVLYYWVLNLFNLHM